MSEVSDIRQPGHHTFYDRAQVMPICHEAAELLRSRHAVTINPIYDDAGKFQELRVTHYQTCVACARSRDAKENTHGNGKVEQAKA